MIQAQVGAKHNKQDNGEDQEDNNNEVQQKKQ